MKGLFYFFGKLAYHEGTMFLLTFQKIQDGKPTNVNYANSEMQNVTIPRDFLNKTYIARCAFDFKYSCSTLKGEVTDFNIWDRAFTQKEAEDWTTCR